MRAIILLALGALAGRADHALADPLYELPAVGNSIFVRVVCPTTTNGQVETKLCSKSDGSSAIGRIQLRNGEMESMVFDTYELNGDLDRHVVGKSDGKDRDSEKIRQLWATIAPIKRAACDSSSEQRAYTKIQIDKNNVNLKCTKN